MGKVKQSRYWIEYRDDKDGKVLGLVKGIKFAIEAARAFELLEPLYEGKIKIVRAIECTDVD